MPVTIPIPLHAQLAAELLATEQRLKEWAPLLRDVYPDCPTTERLDALVDDVRRLRASLNIVQGAEALTAAEKPGVNELPRVYFSPPTKRAADALRHVFSSSAHVASTFAWLTADPNEVAPVPTTFTSNYMAAAGWMDWDSTEDRA